MGRTTQADLVHRVRTSLVSIADPDLAPAMQAYMKSTMPYAGVQYGPLRKAIAPIFRELTFRDAAEWQDAVRAIWRGAIFREERYAAIELTSVRAARDYQRVENLGLYEELIVSGAWWDYVDAIAGPRLWILLRDDRQTMTAKMREWARSDDMWKRRSAIICQLHAKRETDLDLLYDAIEQAVDSREFFLRKAIGWALRQYARIDPGEVTRYVGQYADRLSPLSKREALKRIPAEMPA